MRRQSSSVDRPASSDIKGRMSILKVDPPCEVRRAATARTHVRVGLMVALVALVRTTFGMTGPASRADTIRLDRLRASHRLVVVKSDGSQVWLRADGHTMQATLNSRRLLFDNTLLYMNGGLLPAHFGRYALTRADVTGVLTPLLLPPAVRSRPPRIVAIDPGHGGADAGATWPDGSCEKQMTLDIARRVAARLPAAGLVPKLTREDDHTLELKARIDAAAREQADVLISIHINSSPNPDARGMETYVLPAAGCPSTTGQNNAEPCLGNRHDARNTRLGYLVQRRLLEATQAPDRGVRRARFVVLKEAPCPAVLVECGFLSHADERTQLNDSAYREAMAEGIARGVVEFAAWSALPPSDER